MKKLLIMMGAIGAVVAAIRLYKGWKDDTPSARELKDLARETSEAVKDGTLPARHPVHSMG